METWQRAISLMCDIKANIHCYKDNICELWMTPHTHNELLKEAIIVCYNGLKHVVHLAWNTFHCVHSYVLMINTIAPGNGMAPVRHKIITGTNDDFYYFDHKEHDVLKVWSKLCLLVKTTPAYTHSHISPSLNHTEMDGIYPSCRIFCWHTLNSLV